MRTWVLAVAALTLVALTRPITADKRSSALAVRVTVVRSCSVSTDGGMLTGTVTCGSRFGPPVMSATSTITVPVSQPPAARIDTANVPQNPALRQDAAVVAAPETMTTEPVAAIAQDASPAVAVLRAPGTAPADPVPVRAETMAFRVVTVNF